MQYCLLDNNNKHHYSISTVKLALLGKQKKVNILKVNEAFQTRKIIYFFHSPSPSLSKGLYKVYAKKIKNNYKAHKNLKQVLKGDEIIIKLQSTLLKL